MELAEHTKSKMAQVLEHLKNELKSIRTGRANPGMLDQITVDVYGSQMRLKEIASISIPEPRQLLITPFDRSHSASIGKAIEKANLGFMPIVDGNAVRINIPAMSEEIRKEMIKVCNKRREEAKISIRNFRREANDLAKKQKNEGLIAEDMMKKLEKTVQDLTDKFCAEADSITEKKEKEVATI